MPGEHVVVRGIKGMTKTKICNLHFMVLTNKTISGGQIPVDATHRCQVFHPTGNLHSHKDKS